MLDLARIEEELDSGTMKARMTGGNLWQVRRNGKTQTWKTRPGAFRIPVKAGFRSCGEITERSIIGRPGDRYCDFMIHSMC